MLGHSSSVEDVSRVLEGVVAALPRTHVAEALATVGNVAELLDDAISGSDSQYITEAIAALEDAGQRAQRAQAALELGAHSLGMYVQSMVGAGGCDARITSVPSADAVVLAPKPEGTLITAETARQVHDAMEALLPASQASSTRKYIETLQSQSNTVLCELLRRDIPLADYVLVDRHIKLVLDRAWKIVRHHPDQSLEVHELLGAGIEAYLLACRRYSDEGNAKMTTFASDYAYYEMLKVADKESNTVAVPYVFRQTVINKIRKIDTARLNDGEPPMTDQEISEMFGLPLDNTVSTDKRERTVKDVRNAQRLLYTVSSLGASNIAFSQHANDIERSPTDDPRGYDTAWVAVGNVMHEKLKKEIDTVLGTLEEREAAIIRAHFGIGGPALSLSEIGKRMHYTASGIHLIEKKALVKIREEYPHLVLFWQNSIEES